MSKFQELQKEDYSFLLFNQFLYTTALNNRKPFKAIQFEIDDMHSALVIFSKTSKGTVTTKQFKLDKAEMFFFLQWLGDEFPAIEFVRVDEDDESK